MSLRVDIGLKTILFSTLPLTDTIVYIRVELLYVYYLLRVKNFIIVLPNKYYEIYKIQIILELLDHK